MNDTDEETKNQETNKSSDHSGTQPLSLDEINECNREIRY